MRTFHGFTLAAGRALVLSFIFFGCDDSKAATKPTNSNLAGSWELLCDANLSYKEKKGLASNMEFFNDGTGTISPSDNVNFASKWQLREGNRLQITVTLSGAEQTEINEIGLSEKGMVLTFHYDGTNYSGEKPRKAVYIKKGAKREGNIVANAPFAFTDTRDGKRYKAVKINEQTFMAENLNFEAEGSKCYENKPENCAKYGRLYNWNTAMSVCPTGWHLPTNEEWDKLYRYVDGTGTYRCVDGNSERPYESGTAGKFLKSTSGWNNNGNGTDNFGFAALPGGYGTSGGYFDGAGGSGNWWSASEYNGSDAYGRHMGYLIEYARWGSSSKTVLFSVRCVQD